MPDLASAISAAGLGGTVLRTGRVVSLDGATLTVDVGGGQQVAMAYLEQYRPILGDSVQILTQSGTIVVLGRVAGMPPDNAVNNPSFEVDPPGSTSITGWSSTSDPAATTTASVKVDTASGWGPVDGMQWLELNQNTSGESITYIASDPIAVTPGDKWTAAARAIVCVDDGGVGPGTVFLKMAWFANSTDAYPTTSAPDTDIQGITGPVGCPTDWTLLRAYSGDGTVVPAAANFMRVVLVTDMPFSGSTYWDAVVARQVSRSDS